MLAAAAPTPSAREISPSPRRLFQPRRSKAAGMAFMLMGAGAFMASDTVFAATLTVQVSDASGQPLVDAVVYAESPGSPVPLKSPRTVDIEQKGRKFLPVVTAIQAGTSISFPNNDTVRHHVYSVSTPRPFDIKLYTGQPANPIHFDKPGTVVLGCNIHDQMVAYVHVVSTPWFGKSDASGKVRLDDLPPGRYELKTWHPAMPLTAAIPSQAITLAKNDVSTAVKLGVKAAPSVN
jgi:plastocyanin